MNSPAVASESRRPDACPTTTFVIGWAVSHFLLLEGTSALSTLECGVSGGAELSQA